MASHQQPLPDPVHVSDRRDHLLGPRTAPVALLEYGDFECPHCGQAHFILQELLTQLRGEVRLAFRHFPLTTIHAHAFRAAEAAESAGAQGSFWDMHDLLFENQDALEDEDLVNYASALGLDLDRFQLDLVQRTYATRVQEDLLSGAHAGVKGTPTFFINGHRHDGAWDLASLAAAVNRAAVPPAGDQGHGPATGVHG